MANRNTQVQDQPEAPKTFSIRSAARYLQDNGADIGEMRMRTLVRQHDIFSNDPNTRKSKADDNELETWKISQSALDQYLEARKNGTVRSNTGSKAYKLTLSAEQFAKAREVLAAAGLPEPARLNKTSKAKANGTSGNGALGSDGHQAEDEDDTLDALLEADEDSDD